MVNDISAMKHLPKVFFKNDTLPMQLIYFVTTRCNAACPHCFYSAELNNPLKKDMSLEEIQKFSKSMDDLLVMYFGGGEPFLRTDLPVIAEIFYKNNNVRLFGIPTNAFLPVLMLPSIDRMCQKCPDANILINISLDDIGIAHEQFRKVPGGWAKLLETIAGIKELQKKHKNLALGTNCTFTTFNQDRIKDIYLYMRDEIKPDSININLVRGTPKERIAKNIDISKYREVIQMLQHDLDTGKLGYTTSSFQPFINQNQRRTKELIYNTFMDNKAHVECIAARLMGVVYPDGDVFPCEILEDPKWKLGNLRESDYDMRKIWFSPKTKETAKWIVDTKCFCTHECFMSTNTMFDPKEMFSNAVVSVLHHNKAKS
jgi:radical SAM protein with 4Fe4S-binding SPASM domain